MAYPQQGYFVSSNATTTTIFQPSTSRSTWSSAPLAATTPWCNSTGTDADGHECWFQNSWAFRTKNESSPSSSSRCNGSTSNGTTNDACNDERSWTNPTTPRRSRSKPSYGSGQSTSCSSRRSRSPTSSNSNNPNLLYSFKDKNLLQQLCWPLRHHKNKSRCWVNDCFLSSKECILILLERLLACCWRSTTPNWFICWKTLSLSRARSMKQLLFFKHINLKLIKYMRSNNRRGTNTLS